MKILRCIIVAGTCMVILLIYSNTNEKVSSLQPRDEQLNQTNGQVQQPGAQVKTDAQAQKTKAKVQKPGAQVKTDAQKTEAKVQKPDAQVKTDAQAQKTEAKVQNPDAQVQETEAQMKKTDAQVQKTNTQVQKTAKQVSRTESQDQATNAKVRRTNVLKDLVSPDSKGFVDYNELSKVTKPKECAVCKSGVPCEYPDEVDLRIIVLGFNRETSLQKCLDRIPKLVLDGAKIAVDIWLDLRLDNRFHYPTYLLAQNFSSSWEQGMACVHVQTNHSNADKQWLFSWRPRENSKEMVLMIEDDIDISPYSARWLLLANKTFFDDSSVYAYSLKSEMLCGQQISGCIPINAPQVNVAFKTPVFGNWGFSPKGNFWRKFQDWYIDTLRKTPSYKPYVEGLHRYNTWYKDFEKQNKEHTMSHEMFVIHYVAGHREKVYCLYHNLQKFTGKAGAKLSTHRQENGMHFHNAAKRGGQIQVLMDWDPKYGNFSKDCPSFDLFGNLVPNF